ncbi:MAG: hypothetical protein ACPGJV_02615 [Bacteriovoracaceae bacterium]
MTNLQNPDIEKTKEEMFVVAYLDMVQQLNNEKVKVALKQRKIERLEEDIEKLQEHYLKVNKIEIVQNDSNNGRLAQ